MPEIFINQLEPVSWKNISSHSFAQPGNTIDIWHIQVPIFFEQLTKWLVPEEKEKMTRFRDQVARQRFASSRGGLRFLTGRYLQQSPASFRAGNTQKPSWQNPGAENLFFNITHADDSVLIAFSGNEIGIDVEKIQNPFSYAEILEKCFTENEINRIREAVDPRATFYLLWTRKEALLKATGKGIHDRLPLVPSLDGNYQIEDHVIGSGNDWQISSFTCKESYQASIAFHTAVKTISFIDLTI